MFRNIQESIWDYTPVPIRDIYRIYIEKSPKAKQSYEKPQRRINAEETAKEHVKKTKEGVEERNILLEFSVTEVLRDSSKIEPIKDFKSFSTTINNEFGQLYSSIDLFSEEFLKELKEVCLHIESPFEDMPYTKEEWTSIQKRYQYKNEELTSPQDAMNVLMITWQYKKYNQVANQLNGDIFTTLRLGNQFDGKKMDRINNLEETWKRRRKFAALKSVSLKELSDRLNQLENYLSWLTAAFLRDKSVYDTVKETINNLYNQTFAVDIPATISEEDKQKIGYYVHDMAGLIAEMRQDLAEAMFERIVIAHKKENQPSGEESLYDEDVLYDTLESLVEIDTRLKPTIDNYKLQAPPRRPTVEIEPRDKPPIDKNNEKVPPKRSTLSKNIMAEFYVFINEYGTEEQKEQLHKSNYDLQDFMQSAIVVKKTTYIEDIKINDIIEALNKDLEVLTETIIADTQENEHTSKIEDLNTSFLTMSSFFVINNDKDKKAEEKAKDLAKDAKDKGKEKDREYKDKKKGKEKDEGKKKEKVIEEIPISQDNLVKKLPDKNKEKKTSSLQILKLQDEKTKIINGIREYSGYSASHFNFLHFGQRGKNRAKFYEALFSNCSLPEDEFIFKLYRYALFASKDGKFLQWHVYNQTQLDDDEERKKASKPYPLSTFPERKETYVTSLATEMRKEFSRIAHGNSNLENQYVDKFNEIIGVVVEQINKGDPLSNHIKDRIKNFSQKMIDAEITANIIPVLSGETYQLIEEYLNKIKKHGMETLIRQGEMGNRLYAVLKNSYIQKLTTVQFIDALLKTNNPIVFAENSNHVKGDGTDWTKEEISLLGRIARVVKDVTVYAKTTYNPKAEDIFREDERPKATLLYTNGALLTNSQADLSRVTNENGEFDESKYDKFLEENLLPSLIFASNDAGKSGAVVTMPILGGGSFAGRNTIYESKINNYFSKAVFNLISKHDQQLGNLKGVVITGIGKGKGTHNPGQINNQITFITTDTYSGVYPSAYDDAFKKYKTYTCIAGDHVSFPGNDSIMGSPSTSEGGTSIVTNVNEIVSRFKGYFHELLKRFMPVQNEDVINGSDTFFEVYEKTNQTLAFSHVEVCAVNGQPKILQFEKTNHYNPQHLGVINPFERRHGLCVQNVLTKPNSDNSLDKQRIFEILKNAARKNSTDSFKSKILQNIQKEVSEDKSFDAAIQKQIKIYLESDNKDIIYFLIKEIQNRIRILEQNRIHYILYTTPNAKITALKMLQEHLILFDLGLAKENLVSNVIENWLNSVVVTSTKNGQKQHTAREILGEQRFIYSLRNQGDTPTLEFIHCILKNTRENEHENKINNSLVSMK